MEILHCICVQSMDDIDVQLALVVWCEKGYQERTRFGSEGAKESRQYYVMSILDQSSHSKPKKKKKKMQ